MCIRSIRLEANLARGDRTSHSKVGAGRKKKPVALKLVRVEPKSRKGILLVFESGGEEQGWLLAQTSITEFMALLLRGQMRSGRRIQLDEVEVTIEPPAVFADDPLLCVAMGPLEFCAPVDQATVKAMRADLNRAMKRPH